MLKKQIHLATQPLSIHPFESWPRRLVRFGIWGVSAIVFLGLSVRFGYHLGDQCAKQTRKEALQNVLDQQKRDDDYQKSLSLLQQHVKVLEGENGMLQRALAEMQQTQTALQEKIHFFEGLLTQNDRHHAINLHHCVFLPVDTTQGRWSWKALATQGFNPDTDFRGSAMLVVKLKQKNRIKEMNLAPQRVAFRHYSRLQGVFDLPLDTTPLSFEVVMMTDGASRPVSRCKQKGPMNVQSAVL